MANERQKRLMQEALDETLTPEARRQLFAQLDRDADGAAEFKRLRQVDQILRTAPFEHAPERLAAAILARLAETLQSEQFMRTSGMALALALALVTLLMMPLLIAAGWLVLTALGSAAALSSALHQVIGLLVLVLGVMEVFVERAQDLLKSSPETPALLLTLIPVALYGLLRYAMRDNDTEAV
jgi:hypothetical protein